MSNEEDIVISTKELEKQLTLVSTAINMQSNDPDDWAIIKDSTDFEKIGKMTLIQLYQLKDKLRDEQFRRLESVAYNFPSIDHVTANAPATATRKGEPFTIDRALI